MNKPRLERALNRNFLVIIICPAFLLVGNDSDTIPDSNAASIKCQQFPEKLKRCEVFTCSYRAQIPLNNQVMSITRTVHGAKDRKCRVSEVIKNQKEEIIQKNLCKFEAGILDKASVAYTHDWMSLQYNRFIEAQVLRKNCKKLKCGSIVESLAT